MLRLYIMPINNGYQRAGVNSFLASTRAACLSLGMDWRDEGTVLSVRPHSENAAIIEVFTTQHGRHAGVVRGGGSRRMAPVLQPGNQVAVAWHARLEDHIGSYTVELVKSRSALLADRLGLAGLNAICAMLRVTMPEREAYPVVYQATHALLHKLEFESDWPASYMRWELLLLEEIGFALELNVCAITGTREDLAFVSPKSGRAVNRAAAGEWASKLLALPQTLMGQGTASRDDLVAGLALTGHFLDRALIPTLNGHPLPSARTRLLGLFHNL
jgi:DNA repair protein RecO (recombination protein O)